MPSAENGLLVSSSTIASVALPIADDWPGGGRCDDVVLVSKPYLWRHDIRVNSVKVQRQVIPKVNGF
jgi:hypothetical protein